LMKTNNECLITGGGGFIGLHLAKKLKEYGYKVTILDVNHVETSDCEGMQFIKGSVLDESLLQRIVPLYSYVFHLAALLGVRRSMTGTVNMIHNNVIGTMNVLKASLHTKSKVIFASTSEVFGKAEPPFTENGDLVFGTPTKLRWSYAIAKSLEESLCLGYGLQGLPVSIVRYFNVYGPRQKEGLYGGVIPRFIKAALDGKEIPVYGNGLQTRSFTYVGDAVELTIRTAFEPKAEQQIVNIGAENEISVLQLAKKIKCLAQSSSPIVHVPFEQVYPEGFEEIPRRRPSTAKSADLLGFKAETSLDQGLTATIHWYKQAKRENDGGSRL
jgi:UDP-glucose 4-epimerase